MSQGLPFFGRNRQISNDPNRFQGDGVICRAKLIGVMEVPELKGDRMCFDTMQKLKLEVLRRGEHKPRIFVGISLDGVKIRKNDSDRIDDEVWYHHEVRCISFIWRDPTDARAMGYVTAAAVDAKKQFIAIKTERAADQTITALKDLFQAIIDKKNQNGNTTQTDATQLNSVEEEAVVAKVATEAASAPPSSPPPAVPAPAADKNLLDWDATEPAAPPVAAPRKQENLFDMLMDSAPEPSSTNAAPAPAPAAAAAAAAAAPTNNMKTSDDLSDMFGGAYSPQTAYQSSSFDLFSPTGAPSGGMAQTFSWDGPPTPSTSSNPLFDAPSNASGSLFNAPSNQGGSLFNAPSNQGGSLFNAPSNQGGATFNAPSNQGSSLFDAPNNQGGSLFNAPSSQSGSLFNAASNQGGSLFDTPSNQGGSPFGGGSLFDTAPSSNLSGAPTMGNNSALFGASGAPPAVPPRSIPSGSVNPFFNSSMPTMPGGQTAGGAPANAAFGGLAVGTAPGLSSSAFSSSSNPAFGSASSAGFAAAPSFGSAASQPSQSPFGDMMGIGSSFQSSANPFGAAAPSNTGWGAPAAAPAPAQAANPFGSSAAPAAAPAQSSMSNPFFSGPKKDQAPALFGDLMSVSKEMYVGLSSGDASKPKPAERGKALFELAQPAPAPAAPAPAPAPASSQTFGLDSTFSMGSTFSGGSLMD